MSSASSTWPATSPLVTTSTLLSSRAEISSTSPAVTTSPLLFSSLGPFTTQTSQTSFPHLSTTAHFETSATPQSSLGHFTVNFTITNLPYTSDLENPDSAKFRATQRVMNMLLDRLLKESSIGPVFQRCETTDLRYGSCSNTRVDAVCAYSKEPSAAPLDRVGLYHQVSNKTRGITQLGPYSLDKDSLYVNGDQSSSLGLFCSPTPALPQCCPLPSSSS
uniref:Uncharacterized protein n=1 Tax=Corvus moneduloides TaxID=1196302 RepID=A0A8U7P4X6_CORMO